jgi:hypothetical protein
MSSWRRHGPAAGVVFRAPRCGMVSGALASATAGEEMEELLKRAYAPPKALVQKAAEYSGALWR